MSPRHVNLFAAAACAAALSAIFLLGPSLAPLPSAAGAWASAVLLVCLVLLARSYLLERMKARRFEERLGAAENALREAKDVADLNMNAVESLAIAIDAKDQTTHGHVRRSRVYAVELGRALGLAGAELEALWAGALLHDVGKLAIPEYILNKPGKLTPAEFERIKVHPRVGGDIVRRINFPYPVEDAVRYHHEKWDGSGYPEGLRGEQIPLVARIISVVDFYDTIRCERPYRPGKERAASIAQLRSMAGTSFDPSIVERFVENLDHFDSLIPPRDLSEQVQPKAHEAAPHAEASNGARARQQAKDDVSGFRTIAEAQREVFALHEIAQSVGASLSLSDTLTLVAGKVGSILPFDTCVMSLLDEASGTVRAAHAEGADAEHFMQRSLPLGEGVTGWVIANSRSMCETPPAPELAGLPESVRARVRSALVCPLLREGRAYGSVALYSAAESAYTSEHVRLLEAVALHASGPVHNALVFERTKASALTDSVTGLPNGRALHLSLEQRLAECQRLKDVPLSVLRINIDGFKELNEAYGHGVGDRVLAAAAEVFKQQLRQMDLLARLDADNFAALMPGASGEVAARVAERVRSAVDASRFSVRTGRSIRVSVSTGVGSFPADGESAEELLAAAEQCLLREKGFRRVAAGATVKLSLAPTDAAP